MNKYYWDSCAFISRIQGNPDRIKMLEHFTDKAAEGEIQIVTSSLTVAEVCFINREGSLDEKLRDIDTISRFFDNDYIYIVQVSRQISTEAAKIGVQHKVKPPDAIHLATALHSDCQVVHTYDATRLLKLDGKVGIPPLTICKPSIQFQQELFSDDDLPPEPEEPEPKGPLLPRKNKSPVVRRRWSMPRTKVWGRASSLIGRYSRK